MALPLDLVWGHTQHPETDAVVTVRHRTLLRPKAGSVHISGQNPCQIRVITPKWSEKTTDLETFLYRSYREILKTAQARGCRRVLLPLLSANSSFPRSLDYRIATEVLMSYAAEQDMNVYLILDRTDPVDSETARLEEYQEKAAREVMQDLRREARQLQTGQRLESFSRETHEDILQVPDLEEYPSGSALIGDELTDVSLSIDFEDYSRELPPMPFAMPEKAPLPDCAPTSIPYFEELKEELKKHRTERRQQDESFLENLFHRINDSGMTDPDIYKNANISRQVFSKMRDKYANRLPYTPTKATAVALAIALKLDLEQTQDLIGRAGHTLSQGNDFDLTVSFYIRRKHYCIADINQALWELDQSLLGSSSL